MITDFLPSRRGNGFRVSLRLNGVWGHGEGWTVKIAKRAAVEDAKSKITERPILVWRAE